MSFSKRATRRSFAMLAVALRHDSLRGLLLFTIWLPPAATRMGRTVFKGFTQMLRQPVWIILSVAVILVMIANNSWLNFLGITVIEMGATDSLVGWMWSVGVISEYW